VPGATVTRSTLRQEILALPEMAHFGHSVAIHTTASSKALSRFSKRISTVVETLRAHDRDVVQYLAQACDAHIRQQPAPMLASQDPRRSSSGRYSDGFGGSRASPGVQ
jgi:hypothetical protein